MEKAATSSKFPVPSSQLIVWVFVPHRMTELGIVCREHSVTNHQELADAFAELGIKWKWQPITFENMHAVVEEVAASSSEYTPLVLNYCDGEEMLEYPGTCVIELLEEKGIVFTGAGSAFSQLCSSKILEKQAFTKASVPTSPYEVISDINQVQGICDRLGTPLIVKPAMSCGSLGISTPSVVFNDEQAVAQVQGLVQGQYGMLAQLGNIFVERFISGSEFTVLLVGSAKQPDSLKIYPPVEKIFHSSLPETERFLTFELCWEQPEEASPLPSESICRFQLVESPLREKLCELGKRAYCAVGGNGYGTVDVRMDKTSQELFVLEVNANCFISPRPFSKFYDLNESAAGTILHLSNIPFAQLMSDILSEAFVQHASPLPKPL
jgi:D-alanine-D-alanine ligase